MGIRSANNGSAQSPFGNAIRSQEGFFCLPKKKQKRLHSLGSAVAAAAEPNELSFLGSSFSKEEPLACLRQPGSGSFQTALKPSDRGAERKRDRGPNAGHHPQPLADRLGVPLLDHTPVQLLDLLVHQDDHHQPRLRLPASAGNKRFFFQEKEQKSFVR